MSPDTRTHVHALVDQLPEAQLSALETLLESIVADEDELTPEDRVAIQAGIESLNRNGGVPMEEVLADFGLTMDDFEKMTDER